MVAKGLNSLVGITNYDEGTNLSCYLIGHGWNAEHAVSADEVLSDLEEERYQLVVLDEEMLTDSQWTLAEYLEEIGPETAVLILTEPGSLLTADPQTEPCYTLQHPYTYESLRIAIERAVYDRYETPGEEEAETSIFSDSGMTGILELVERL